MEQEDVLMKNSGLKKSFCPSRRRQQAAKHKRFCMNWINRMVNKQVAKQIAHLCSELLLMHYTMREEMAEELQDQLRELREEEERERALFYERVKRERRMASRWRTKMEKEYKEEKEKDEPDSPDLETSSFNFCQTPSETDSISIIRKNDLGGNLRIFLDVSSSEDTSDGASGDGDFSDGDSSDVSNDADMSLQAAKCEQQENQQIPLDDAVATTSQLMKESPQKKKSSNPCLANPSFTTEELQHKKEPFELFLVKEKEALLMDRQWKEWLDKQETRGTHNTVKPAEQQNTEEQGEAKPPPVPQRQVKHNVKEVDAMTKMKTKIFDLFSPSYKWERLENED